MNASERHAWGRGILLNAWPTVVGADPSLGELQIAGAVAELETNYGRGWKGEGANSFNWGAIICTNQVKAGPGGCLAGCFANTDSSPGEEPELRCFRMYPSPEAGASDLIKTITVRRPGSLEAMRAGDIDAFSADMHRTHYYEGTIPNNPQANIDVHAQKVWTHVQNIAKALGEPIAATRGGPGQDGGASPGGGSTLLNVCTGLALGYIGIRLFQRSRG